MAVANLMLLMPCAGPRSYAIIEQGMISRLIEAKPEELRTYLEEAAGISKYKERRKETEQRMKLTQITQSLSHGVNRGIEVGLISVISVISVISGSDVDCVR